MHEVTNLGQHKNYSSLDLRCKASSNVLVMTFSSSSSSLKLHIHMFGNAFANSAACLPQYIHKNCYMFALPSDLLLLLACHPTKRTTMEKKG